jgi:hypothetical protein
MDTTIFVDLSITSRSESSFCQDMAPKMRITERRTTVSLQGSVAAGSRVVSILKKHPARV